MKTLVVDIGMGNLGSVRRAFEECGADVLVSDDPRDLRAADHVVLPGVGAFADAMRRLEQRGWAGALTRAVREEGLPLLGICLGMQLLADRGFEGGERAGLGLIAGEVRKLEPGAPGERVPHVGWNEVRLARAHASFEGIGDGTDFYFVHGYQLLAAEQRQVLATTAHGGGFVSAAACGSAVGVQFHPEKSGRPGFRLIRNFLAAAR